MATYGWGSDRAVADWLFAEGYRFDFYQAVKLLELLRPDATPVAEGSEPANEPVRFASAVSLAFPASEVAAVHHQAEDGQPPVMTVNFLGLAGARGPLPPVFSELILERLRARDTAMRDFLDIFNHALINSFTTPPLADVDTQGLTDIGFSSVINQAGNVVYARTASGVDAFAYDSSGNIGPSIGGSFPLAIPPPIPNLFGVDVMALHPNGTKLYVSRPGAVDVFDANTGAFLTSITDPNIVLPVGLCLGQPPPPPVITSPIPTLSEWGLIALAGVLGLVGFMVMRRRKVTA